MHRKRVRRVQDTEESSLFNKYATEISALWSEMFDIIQKTKQTKKKKVPVLSRTVLDTQEHFMRKQSGFPSVTCCAFKIKSTARNMH